MNNGRLKPDYLPTPEEIDAACFEFWMQKVELGESINNSRDGRYAHKPKSYSLTRLIPYDSEAHSVIHEEDIEPWVLDLELKHQKQRYRDIW